MALPLASCLTSDKTLNFFQFQGLLPVSLSLSFFFNLQNRHIDTYFIELLQEFGIGLHEIGIGLHEIGIGFNEINSEVLSVELDI